jgi:hypothetical protein
MPPTTTRLSLFARLRHDLRAPTMEFGVQEEGARDGQ